mmetsp:Transcript_52609/g.114902  ORF Transcript_52609/g.114902 Transcript_52609/m.114902 type:complete len:553 (+) Transcript_52609:60-1718(+)
MESGGGMNLGGIDPMFLQQQLMQHLQQHQPQQGGLMQQLPQMQQMQQMQMQHMQQQQQQMQQQQQQQQPQPPPPQSQPQPPPPQSKPSQPPPPPPQQEKIDIQAQMAELEKMKCPLHAKKPKAVCRMCKTYKDMLDKIQAQGESKKSSGGGSSAKGGSFAESDRSGPLELANPKNYGFAGLLQTHITESAHYKSLNEIETIEALVDETYQYANSIEPYMPNSNTIPSGLFVCLYKFFTMNLDGQSLKRLMNSQESPFIRCCGFLYVRMGLPHDQILGWLGEYLLDDEEFKPAPDSEGKITIGEFVESILSQDKYYSTVLPRLPMSTKRHVEEKLAALGQNRKRMQANKGIIEVFRESNVRIECLIGGEWLPATVIELDDDPPNRPKVRAKLEDGTEEYVHLGLVIVVDSKVKQVSRRRSRSRSRHDWSREKGRSDKELVEELRSKDRDRAVCTNGKTYAKKPLGYKAQCALPREQGKAATKLMEEETTVHVSRKSSRRSPSPRQEAFGKRPSAEHQARMQQLFEKYGNQARMESGGAGGSDMLDRADVMRLG